MKTADYQALLAKHALPAGALKRYTDPEILPKSSRIKQNSPDFGFGQARAIKAINTALDIRAKGYHVFAVGENGLGKRALITRLLQQRAKDEPTPDDWIYVHDFAAPRTPIAIAMPAGFALDFQEKLHNLWQISKQKLAAKLLSDTHQNQIELIKSVVDGTQSRHYETIKAKAASCNLALHFKDGRGELLPIDDAHPIDTDAKLSLLKELTATMSELDTLEDAVHEEISRLHKDTARRVLKPLFAPLFEELGCFEKICTHLENMLNDMVQHVAQIVNEDDDFRAATLARVPSRYAVNVLVSHKANSGAPIVFEDLPTHLNLLGHIEYATELGTVLTDVSMIRAGALHRANGGYLILEAQSLLEHPYAWQGLKRALQSQQIKISSLEQMLTLTGSLSLSPDSIALDVKVILLGEADLYYELLEFEPEFNAVFKIRADFHHDIARTDDSERAMSAKMIDIIHALKLPAFDNTALAAICDKMSEVSDDKNKLDLHADRLSQLLVESARIGTQMGVKTISAAQVACALADMHERTSYLQELYWQEIHNGQQIISTHGKAVGQINALTIISYADSEFGLPARLTALIAPRFGSGEILDIERDVELGGSLHAKGMLIMSSFLRAQFSEFHDLNFSASLAFEQSYAHIDGDSATLAESCVLLSALSNVPILQNLAITGSMNQLGQAQAVGGVSAKVAGFFDACAARTLTGDQGVIIPRSNLDQLMLRDDIVEAVRAGQFHLYAVDNITQALALLTGTAVDDRNKNGEFKRNTLFGKISKRLAHWEEESETDGKHDKKKK